MNTLQVSLAVIGGLVLVAVIIYNTWTARRDQPRQAEPERYLDAAESGRMEPSLDSELLTSDAKLDPDLDFDLDLDDSALAAGGLGRPVPAATLDALIDVIAPIALDGHEVSGDAVLAALPATRRVGSKPFFIEAQTGPGAGWEFPRAGRRYHTLQAGLQLANRTGAMNQIEFSEFVMKMQHFADAVGGAAEFPDMQHEVERARELDQFASQHDAQLGFTLRPQAAAWSVGFVSQQAGRQGFVPGAVPGRMVLPAGQPGLPPLLSLGFDAQAALSEDPSHATVHELHLLLDVPQVASQTQPFERLCDVAFALAESMDGRITDDAGQPLHPDMMQAIDDELQRLYLTLEQYDLAAGSPQARRLFS